MTALSGLRAIAAAETDPNPEIGLDPRIRELLRRGGGYYLGYLPGMAPKRKRPTPPGWEDFRRSIDEIT